MRTELNKKLSYRRGTARRALSVITMVNVAQMFVELHLISPALGEWHSKSSKVIQKSRKRTIIWHKNTARIFIQYTCFCRVVSLYYITGTCRPKWPNTRFGWKMFIDKTIKCAEIRLLNQLQFLWALVQKNKRFTVFSLFSIGNLVVNSFKTKLNSIMEWSLLPNGSSTSLR